MSDFVAENSERLEEANNTTNPTRPSLHERQREASGQYERQLAESRAERHRKLSQSIRSSKSSSAPQSPSSHSIQRIKSPLIPDEEGRRTPKSAVDRPRSPQVRSPRGTPKGLNRTVLSAGPSSPLTRQFPSITVPSSVNMDSLASSPLVNASNRLPYQVQGVTRRSDAQTLELDTTFRQPMPRAPNPPSVPQTPITPSKLSLQSQVSSSMDSSAGSRRRCKTLGSQFSLLHGFRMC